MRGDRGHRSGSVQGLLQQRGRVAAPGRAKPETIAIDGKRGGSVLRCSVSVPISGSRPGVARSARRNGIGEVLHQRREPVLGHVGDQVVEHTALPKQRVGAGFARVGLQQPVHAEAFDDGAQQGEQCGGEGEQFRVAEAAVDQDRHPAGLVERVRPGGLARRPQRRCGLPPHEDGLRACLPEAQRLPAN